MYMCMCGMRGIDRWKHGGGMWVSPSNGSVGGGGGVVRGLVTRGITHHPSNCDCGEEQRFPVRLRGVTHDSSYGTVSPRTDMHRSPQTKTLKPTLP